MRGVIPWLLFTASLSVNAQTDKPFTLVCHVGNDRIGYQDHNVVVDPAASTVNDNHAKITEGEIKWVVETSGSTVTTTINRFSGAANFQIDSKKDRSIANVPGTCTLATARKF